MNQADELFGPDKPDEEKTREAAVTIARQYLNLADQHDISLDMAAANVILSMAIDQLKSGGTERTIETIMLCLVGYREILMRKFWKGEPVDAQEGLHPVM